MTNMSDYEKIASAVRYLSEQSHQQPTLAELADFVGLSPFHFQRMFAKWAGVTPKKFLQCLTVQAARERLKSGRSVLEASLDVGLSGPGRLHDLTVLLEAATPGEIKSGGASWTIQAGFAETHLGDCFIAESPRGICNLEFVAHWDRDVARELLAKQWPNARVKWNQSLAKRLASNIMPSAETTTGQAPLRLLVRGTQFQVRVWQALLRIPPGCLVSYGHVAEEIGNTKASRAVGSAIGKNQIAYLIPCHRVIRETGIVGDYRWGTIRKKTMIAAELARFGDDTHAN
ncbi:MAG: methylated-DNA--[protein]-cysteine S-methyltransferase [Aureliella sp.]